MQEMPSEEIVRLSVELLKSKRGRDILTMDLRELSDVADHFVVCTGDSEVQIRALADAVVEGMEALGHRPWHVEGYEARRWVLIDFVDVVVHIFEEETRQFYALEHLWGDAPIERFEEEGQEEGQEEVPKLVVVRTE